MKWIYLEWSNGDYIGKIYNNPKIIYDVLKINGVKVISTIQKSKLSEVWRLYLH